MKTKSARHAREGQASKVRSKQRRKRSVRQRRRQAGRQRRLAERKERLAEFREIGAVPSATKEFVGVSLGDARLNARVEKVVTRMAAAPGKSLPNVMQNDSELEGAYRLMNNELATPEKLLVPHVDKTVRRAAEVGVVLDIHDTTEMDYSGELKRDGLGWLNTPRSSEEQGYLAHCSLAVAAETKRPLGLLGLITWTRTGEPKSRRRKKGKSKGADASGSGKEEDKESKRWLAAVNASEDAVAAKASLVHVMDREGDSYENLVGLVQRRFIVRLVHDRCLTEGEGDEEGRDASKKLWDALEGAKPFATKTVTISRRRAKGPPNANKTSGERDARTATLVISAIPVEFKRPNRLKDGPPSIKVNVVLVREKNCPAGETPIEWVLATSEPITCEEEVLRVVEWYGARWIIEEFFKATKTGCAVETRQFESYDALLNLLALTIPIAVTMLVMRSLVRSEPDAPATEALSEVEIEVLRMFSKRPVDKNNPTIRQALYAVAELGGHLKKNGDPGWLTLARGLQDLQRLVQGYLAGQRER